MRRRLAWALLLLLVGSALAACFRKPFTLGRRSNFSFSQEDICNVQFYTSERILLRRSKATIPCAQDKPEPEPPAASETTSQTASFEVNASTSDTGATDGESAGTENPAEAKAEADAKISVGATLDSSSSLHATNCMSSGKLKMRAVNRINEIRIKRGTPGMPLAVATFDNKETDSVQVEYILVGFAPDAPQKSLWFSARDGAAGGRYVLERVASRKVLTSENTVVRVCPGAPPDLASPPGGKALQLVGEGERVTMASLNRMHLEPAPVVQYGRDGAIYNLAEDEMWEAHLSFKERVILREDVDRKTLPGWKK